MHQKCGFYSILEGSRMVEFNHRKKIVKALGVVATMCAIDTMDAVILSPIPNFPMASISLFKKDIN
jgi:hypothetical protein